MLQPIRINNTLIPSKVFFAPINPGWCEEGNISRAYMEFFLDRSSKNIGVCYVGNVALKKKWTSNENTAVLTESPKCLWERLANKILDKGSVPGIQLAWKPVEIVSQKEFFCSDKKEKLKEYQTIYEKFHEYEEVSKAFICGVNEAATAGFKVIQLHAAHGYGLSLLLSRTISGCSEPKETKGFKLLKQIVRGIDINSILLDIRISLFEGFDDREHEKEYKGKLINCLKKEGFHIISLSNGFYNIDKRMIYPTKKSSIITLENAIELANLNPEIVINVSGNMERVIIEKVELPQNLTISIGRQLIADPNFLMKCKNDNIRDIILCSECECCHYYSLGKKGIRNCNV